MYHPCWLSNKAIGSDGMKRRIATPALVIVVGFASACEEINYVRVVAPRALAGAIVAVRGGEQGAQLIRPRSDSTVESDEDIPLPPLAETLVRIGRFSVHL